MSKNCEEMCDLKELKQLLLEFLEDCKEIKKINEKHFESVLSLYNASKQLYKETVRIQQEIIQKLNNYEKPCKTESVPDKNEISSCYHSLN